MPQLRKSSLGLLGLAATAALGATACGGGTAPTTLLTPAQAIFLGEAVWLDAESNISNATITGATAVYNDAPPVGTVALSSVQCTPSTAPASPANADADAIKDSVRFTFSSTCVLNYPAESDTLRGIMDNLDPTPAMADNAVKRVFVGLVKARLRSGKLSYETWNGTRMANWDANTLSHTETNFQTQYVFPDGTAATHLRSWTSNFTADVAGTVMADQTLPSGNWSISGTASWTQGGNTYSINLTTTVALHYNASCTATPRFDAGTLTAAVTKGTQSGTVTIKFLTCGSVSATTA